MPVITVVTVVFNALDNLKLTAESVFKQTAWPDIEYIIVDGGSTDGTLAYLKTLPPAVRWISEPDKGIYDAMNKGITLAGGETIVMLNAGDVFPANTVERLLSFSKEYAVDLSQMILYGDAYYRFDSTSILRPGDVQQMIEGMSICHQAAFVGSGVYKRFGGYSMEYRLAADYEFLLRVFLAEPNTFVHLPEPLVEFQYEGLTSANYMASYNEARQIARRYLNRSQYNKFLRRHYRSVTLRKIEALLLFFWPWRPKPDFARLLYSVRSRFRRGVI